MSLEWLIVGGGIHGVHIAARLLSEAGVEPEALQIVDPGERLLERWRTCTETTGMTHLRSPSVHHLDYNPWSLQHFAGKRRKRKPGLFAPPYDRPHLGLFNSHCDQVIEKFALDQRHVRARVTKCSLTCEGIRVGLSTGVDVSARNIVLAVGASHQPEWPAWAPKDEPRVGHIFESGFDGWPSKKEQVIVVGGGISAAQVSLRLLKEGHRVHLISRHALREHQFDSEPGWLGPKFMNGFVRERNVDRRRALITEARHKGSVPPDVHRALRKAIARGELSWHEDEIHGLDIQDEHIRMQLRKGRVLEVDRVLLATGFAGHRPGGAFVDHLVESASLPCASCGYPIVDKALRWHPHVYVSGPLAELELGPSSRNISGARRAADRLVRAARAQRTARARRAS